MADKEITFETADNNGSIKIANEVVMTIASQAVSEIKGASIASTFAEGIVDKIVKKNTQRGIRVSTDEETGLTSREYVYAGGDAVTGAATVILAMGAGKNAAAAIDKKLQEK